MEKLNFLSKGLVAGVAGAGLLAVAGMAHAQPLPAWDGTYPTAGDPLTSQEYGDFTVYSLNYLTQLSEKNRDPGDPFYVGGQSYDYDTSPGRIQDDIVVITGNTGQVNNNLDTCGGTAAGSGCDNAYPYPSPSDTYMTTSFTYSDPAVVVPGEPSRSTWTATQGALAEFLGDGDLTFIFNLNEDNGGDANTLDGQALLVSARVQLTDAAGNVLVSFYLGANNAIGLPCTAAETWLGGCDALGITGTGEPEADPTNLAVASEGADAEGDDVYDPRLVDTMGPGGFISLDPRWAYVHGAISVDATTGAFLAFGDCVYTGLTNCETVNQNLGANQGAFSVVNLALSDAIRSGSFNGTAVAFMNVDVVIAGQSNGFEQLLITASSVPRQVPTPGTLALVGLGLLGLVGRRRRLAARIAS